VKKKSKLVASWPEEVQHLFSAQSPLIQALPGFVPREVQQQLANAIAQSILEPHTLIAEAGTGTGKTFAYLIPSLLSGKKVVISTATKMLQDQLVHRDIPLLMRLLKKGIAVQNLKGRSNYICEYRLKHLSEDMTFWSRDTAKHWVLIREKFSQLKEGVKEELPEIAEQDPVWPYVTSTTENCLGSDCPSFSTCFLAKARRRAMDAQLVVINHHVYFADLKLKDSGFGALLPGAEVMIFDEAHQLAETASDFYAQRFSTKMLADWWRDLLREWPSLCDQRTRVEHTGLLLQKTLETIHEAAKDLGKFPWKRLVQRPAFLPAWEELAQHIVALEAMMEQTSWKDDENYPDMKRLYERLKQLIEAYECFHQDHPQTITWGETLTHHVMFYQTPVNVAPKIGFQALQYQQSLIFTSATLSVDRSFDSFITHLGLEHARTLHLISPFDYEQQAYLYFPRGLPDPKEAHYLPTLLEQMLPVIELCQGRCFFLFTSHEALNWMAQALPPRVSYPVLVQGQESKSILLNKFKSLGHAILLGTATFWEGVDVKGDALMCVIIDKLPFMNPFDPLHQGRMNYYESLGVSGFEAYTLPAAVIALKQGVGRLIRDDEDRGIVVIADPRLTTRPYGQKMLNSLPAFKKTREFIKLKAFIQGIS
jgi:ATP-dependent DNA helicase DinG